jgi:exopolysaccharide production protein ExoQ
MLLMNNIFGTWAMIGFIAPWVFIALVRRQRVYQAVLENWGVLLLGVLAVVSTLWSDYPKWTLKASIEFLGTLGIGLIAATCIKPRTLIVAIMSAFLITAAISLVTLGSELATIESDTPISGIFGSKNAFSAIMSLLLLFSIVVAADKGQSKLFRFISFLSLVSTPILLFFGHSLGAVLAVIMTLLIFVAAKSLKNLSSGLRILIYLFGTVIIFMALVAPIFTEIDFGKVLNLLGKDTTLTGRTYLWQHAAQYISERPLFGTGFSAFWQIENPRAQELWFASHVPPGAGFNFHNEYLEVLVELGAVGCVLFLAVLFQLTRHAANYIFHQERPEQTFAFIILIFFLIRTPVEFGIYTQFNMGSILLAVLWVYLKPTASKKAAVLAPANIYIPPKAITSSP